MSIPWFLLNTMRRTKLNLEHSLSNSFKEWMKTKQETKAGMMTLGQTARAVTRTSQTPGSPHCNWEVGLCLCFCGRVSWDPPQLSDGFLSPLPPRKAAVQDQGGGWLPSCKTPTPQRGKAGQFHPCRAPWGRGWDPRHFISTAKWTHFSLSGP